VRKIMQNKEEKALKAPLAIVSGGAKSSPAIAY
jgi:hypothetical protein